MSSQHEFQEYLCPHCGSDKLLLGKYDGRCIKCRKGFKTKDANALECGQCGAEPGICACFTTAGQIARLSGGFFVAAINKADAINELVEAGTRMREAARLLKDKKP